MCLGAWSLNELSCNLRDPPQKALKLSTNCSFKIHFESSGLISCLDVHLTFITTSTGESKPSDRRKKCAVWSRKVFLCPLSESETEKGGEKGMRIREARETYNVL
jgi:hypothetical protein